jgi:hypothetical protein
MATMDIEATEATEATGATKATEGAMAAMATMAQRKKRKPVIAAEIHNLPPDDVRRALVEVMQAYKQPRVKSDDELCDRIALYFDTCIERGSHPIVEELALFCGYEQNTLVCIESGRSAGPGPRAAEIIRRAKYCIQALDAKMVQSGKLNFLAYCFRAKNYYGMVDKVEHVVTPGVQEEYSREDIASRYMIDGGDGTGGALEDGTNE